MLLFSDEDRVGEKPTVVEACCCGDVDDSRYGRHASLIVFKITIDACNLFGHGFVAVFLFTSLSFSSLSVVLFDAPLDNQSTNTSVCISDSIEDVILLSDWN